jgi:3-oxoacid CoA-transferase subunit B
LIFDSDPALTGAGVVDLIITDLGAFEVPEKGHDGDLRLLEMAPDVTVGELRAKTATPLRLSNS